MDGPSVRRRSALTVAVVEATPKQGPSIMEITTSGLDLAKSVFQLHGIDASGSVVMRKKLR